MTTPAWMRVVLDDLGLADYRLVWRGRSRRDEDVAHCRYADREIMVRFVGSWRATLYNLLHEAAHALIGWREEWEWDAESEDIAAFSQRYGWANWKHGHDFLRVLVMVGGWYGFDRWEVMRREWFHAECLCDVTERCTCQDWRRDRREFAEIVA